MLKVKERMSSLRAELDSLQESAASDTKSSMGDKYETSREMINLEKGKLTGQLSEAMEMHTILNSFDLSNPAQRIGLGTLVYTNIAKYYIAVALGPIQVGGEQVFVISPGSPLGRQMLNKQLGDQVTVGSSLQKILEAH